MSTTTETTEAETQLRNRCEQLEGRVTTLQNLVARKDQQLAAIGERFLAEAVERDWCDEYNEWAESMNAMLKADIFQPMVNEYERQFSITITSVDSPISTLNGAEPLQVTSPSVEVAVSMTV